MLSDDTAWTATGQPTVRKQRDKWFVRVDGIDTVTGKHRPKQVGSYPSQRSATATARSMNADDRSTERGTVSWLVRRYVAGRTDITVKARQQYEWAIPHIENGLGAIPLATLDRDDVARWIDAVAAGGRLSKRSVQICRTVLRAALSEAVDEGLIPRSPAARVGVPRVVAKPVKEKEVVVWTAEQVDRFLAATAEHRWAIAFPIGVLYGLRRSEVLALRWDDVDTKASTLRIDESLVATNQGAAHPTPLKCRSRAGRGRRRRVSRWAVCRGRQHRRCVLRRCTDVSTRGHLSIGRRRSIQDHRSEWTFRMRSLRPSD
ncbi:MAG: hypothetical protein WKF60_07770, partial [Ilumatobacter sp.]